MDRELNVVKAIDIHVHLANSDAAAHTGIFNKHMEKYFGRKFEVVTTDGLAQMYSDLDMMAVIFGVDSESNTGMPRVSNEKVAEAVRKYPDIFIGFGSVDPWKGKFAVKEVERCVKELGLKGMKFQQITMGFYPNQRRFYPIWEKCAELKVPVIFHMGTTGMGAGAPGGMGLHLKYARPIPYLDDVAADFPELTIIGAHPAWPWQEEMLAIARHKANVYIDLSGWSPKYFPQSLIQYANTLLKDKCMFGSDFPAITPQRWMEDFETIPIRDEVKPKIFLENAKKVLNLT